MILVFPIMDNVIQKGSRGNGRVGQATTSSRGEGLGLVLDRLLRSLEDLGEGFSGERKRVAGLKERLIEERFHLAVLGQFKRGKSTLMNALLGEMLLPTSVVPVTSIPTFLRCGLKRLIRVVFLDGKSKEFPDLSLERAAQILADYVTEERNPTNKLKVASVEVEHPSSLLRQGVVLIDTPGIGSTLRHNTEATLNFLSQCDAALFMVSADPPITEVEVEFLKAVCDKVAKLFFIMNKVDYLTASELKDAVGFFQKALKETGLHDFEPIFTVSARQGVEAKVKEEPILWRKSGLEGLQSHLLDFFSREKSRALELALARKAFAVVADASINVRILQRSLQMPLEDLEERIKIFDQKIIEMEQEKVRMGDLLAGDRRRAIEFLEDLAEKLRNDARGYLRRIISESLQNGADLGLIEREAKAQIEEQIPVFFEAELASFSDAVERRLRAVFDRYGERLDALITTIRHTTANLFDIAYSAPDRSGGLEMTRKPYWVTQEWRTTIGPLPEGSIDRLLPSGIRRRRIQKRLSEEMETLVVHNVENIRWATFRNLDDTFRRFSSTVDEHLQETAEATHRAIRAAHLRRKASEDTVQPELQRLEQKATELAGLEITLAQFGDSL